MPPADEVIDTPLALLFRSTVSLGLATNDTETDLSVSMVTVHVVLRPLPAQAPPQPVSEVSSRGVTVTLTCVPGGKLALQVPGQFKPLGPVITPPWFGSSVSTGSTTTVIDRKSCAVCPPGNRAVTLT